MKIKRLGALGAAFVLSLSSLMALSTPFAGAVVTTLYWCDTTGNGNFSNVNNWNTNADCSTGVKQAPAGSENLVFDASKITAAQVGSGYSATANNDLTNLTIGNITVNGTSSSGYGYKITGNTLTITGGITENGLASNYDSIRFDLPITLGADQTFSASQAGIIFQTGSTVGRSAINLAGYKLTLSGGSTTGCVSYVNLPPLSGAGSVISNYGNLVVLGADSPSYSGSFVVNKGSLRANSTNALGNTSGNTTVNSGGSLIFGIDSNTTFNEPLVLSGTGNGTNATLNVTVPFYGGCSGGGPTPGLVATLAGPVSFGSNVTYGGDYDTVISGAFTNNGFSIKTAAGSTGKITTPQGTSTAPAQSFTVAATDKQPTTQVLVGNNQTYVIDGERGDTFVGTGGILKGTGVLKYLSVNTGGIVAPGHSPGCLTVTGFGLTGTYQAEIGGTTPCTGYDQIKTSDTVNLDATTSVLQVLLYGGFVPKVGQSYTIISNGSSSPISGTFTGLPEGATYTNQGVTYKVTYKGGDGNDVVLTVTAVDASKLPKAPNTGLAAVAAHPAGTLAVTMVAAGLLFGMSRRLKTVRR